MTSSQKKKPKRRATTNYGDPDPISGYSPAAQQVGHILKSLENEIHDMHVQQKFEERDHYLSDYSAIANESAQNLNLKNKEDQESAIKIL